MDVEERHAGSTETEQRLLDCALTLFAEKGYAATSVREIIEAAGVTRPVLYYYCDSKEGIFVRILQTTLGVAYQGLGGVLTQYTSCEDRLRAVMRGSFAFCAHDPRIPRLMFQVHAGPSGSTAANLVSGLTALRFGIIVQIMRDGLDAGEILGGAAEDLALVFSSLMDHPIEVLGQMPSPEACLTQALADALVDVFFNAFGKGEKRPVTLPAIPLGTDHERS